MVPKLWRRSWKRSRRTPALGLCGPAAAHQCVVAEHAPDLVDEHQLVVIGEVVAPAQAGQRERDLRHQRHGSNPVALREVLAAFVGEPALDVQERASEVDRAPTAGRAARWPAGR